MVPAVFRLLSPTVSQWRIAHQISGCRARRRIGHTAASTIVKAVFAPICRGIFERMSDVNHSDNVLGATEPTDNPAAKDPAQWVTGDEPMTAAQRSYLDTLAREAGEQISADLTKAEASEHIERLQERTGRGSN